MKSFFKTFFASFLALIIFSIFAVFILIGIATVFVSTMDTKKSITIHKKSFIVIDLSQKYVENPKENQFSELFEKNKGATPSLQDLIEYIKIAKNDSLVAGIYLLANYNSNGRAASEEIRNALLDFKISNKPIIAYSEVISQSSYFIANLATKIYTNPSGGLEWQGYSVNLMFYKGLLDKLEIEPQIFYAGKFKSATEQYRLKEMSKENKLQTTILMNSLYQQLLLTTSIERHIDINQLKNLADNAQIQTAKNAMDAKLIDDILYEDQVKESIKKLIRIPSDEKLHLVNISEYAKAKGSPYKYNESKIAVLIADGQIVSGLGESDQIGSEKFIKIIEELKNNDKIKGVVLRVNSPGGSALASEVILRELYLLKQKKPIIVSMGNVAASGGYYISCIGDSIFANKNTITGSIGVFGLIPNLNNFFKNKLSITMDGVKTGPFANFGNTGPLNPLEKNFIQNFVDTIYMNFKSRVATNRKKTLEYIDSIAQGRVWIGEDALKNHLIDRIGTLSDAISSMKNMTKFANAQVEYYPEKTSVFEDLIDNIQNKTSISTLQSKMGVETYLLFNQYQKIKQISYQPQMLMHFDFIFSQ